MIMPCEWIKTPDGTVIHVNRTRSRVSLVCRFCKSKYAEGKLCDFPIGPGKTCDAPMCNGCATMTGTQATDMGNGLKKLNDTVDYCPIHKGMRP
jgi:hypothetical protein